MFNSDEPSFTPHGFSPETRFLPGRGMAKMPKIILSREAYTLMALYVELGDQEVGWLGTAIRQEDGDFRIEKVMLFKQQVSGTETEISTEGLQELSMELLGRGEEGIKDWNNMRFWGHSHVRMGTFASGTDENTMLRNRFGGGSFRDRTFCFQDSEYPWAIRGIFNKLGRAQFSIFLYDEGLRIDDAAWEVDAPTESTPQPELLPEPAVDVAALVAENGAATGWTPPGAQPTAGTGALAAAPDAVATTGETSTAAQPAGDSAEEEKPKPWLRRVFARPVRDRRYTPDITAELRRTVEAEFRQKVRSRFVFFRSPLAEEREGKEEGGNLNPGCIVDGEASGPGTTGNFGRTTYGGGGAARSPGVCPPGNSVAKHGCHCWRCSAIRREENSVVAPGFFTPANPREDERQYAEPQESIIVTLGRALFEWLGRR